ncbi:nucleolar protein 12-like [Dendronephthya gigantea]|uniref:nucleolar protein 12-like n=1 Tax=Dendronephthya gigantea TaxID=151771 RepID=UPI001069719B|nr:nucleolar protein 12-like [Dendronephthya gigantea]
MKGKRDKVVLVFDEKDRRDFLTGFRKRKNVRRKKAQEENKKKEEEKRKQLREEKREALRQRLEEYENQQEANDMEDFQDSIQPQESITHDFGEHTVTVSTITDEDMGRDYIATGLPATLDKPKETDTKITSDNQKQATKNKLLRKRQFRKKAQKRKIQAMGDKKSFKQRLKHGAKRK